MGNTLYNLETSNPYIDMSAVVQAVDDLISILHNIILKYIHEFNIVIAKSCRSKGKVMLKMYRITKENPEARNSKTKTYTYIKWSK